MSNQFWSPNHPTINPNRLTRASTRVGGSREALAIAYCATSNFPPQSPPKLLPRSPVLVRFWFVLVVFVGRLLVVCWCCLGRPPPTPPPPLLFDQNKQCRWVWCSIFVDICWCVFCWFYVWLIKPSSSPAPMWSGFPRPKRPTLLGSFWIRSGRGLDPWWYIHII